VYEGLFRHLLFPAYESLARRRDTRQHVAEYERSQWLDREALDALQLRKLNDLLDHCWQHVPFLQQHWRRHGVRPGPLQSLAQLATYPTLTKGDITAHYEDMIAGPWKGRTLSKTTGGSTGVPFRFEYTMDVYARRTAVMWRGYGWGGAGLGTRTAYLWGTGLRKGGWGGIKDRLYHGAFCRRFFDAFSLTESNIDERIDEIIRYRPKAVVGYVAPVVLVARRMVQTGRVLQGVRGVLTGAEALYDTERRDIELAFGCPVFNTYGSREVMLMASECDRHGLHVNADHLVLETLGSGGSPVHGTSGAVAVTDLHNFGMPLVRYLNGDRATYAQAPCACGRGLPLLASVDGRVLDLIETPDGRHVPGEFFVYLMLDWPEVKQWQVVQTAPDCVQFRLVVGTPWTAEQRDRLTAKFKAVAGADMRAEVVEVEAIAAGRSGKRRLTISLANAALAG
jgi:phenylacetate-CoA ligase